MIRQLQPELLDSLPPDHPDERANRRDLRIINRITGDQRWIKRTLDHFCSPDELVLELGAGGGELGLGLAARGVPVDGLDLFPRPPRWPAGRAWHQADLLTFDDYASYPVIVGNLIFHQFSDAQLRHLGVKIRASARVILACEPVRCRRSQFLLAALNPLIGANYVTRHDGQVSVAAGFRGRELPRVLGLSEDHWHISCHATLLGTMRLLAVRLP
jgi:hypothetical protein